MSLGLVKLGQVLDVQNGFAFAKELFSQTDGVPLIRIRDISSRVTDAFYKGAYRDEFVVQPGDYLIGMDGNFRCRRWAGPVALLNQRVCRLRNFRPEMLPEYIFYGIQPALDAIEANTDFATVKHISGRQILNIELPFLPLPEQRRIVDLLSRAEGIVRLRRDAEKKAAEIIPALFMEMFGDPATNPKGWPIALLPDVLARPFKNGLYLPKESYSAEGVEMVHMSDAFYGEVKRGGLRRVLANDKQIDDYGLNQNDLLVARRSLTFEGAAKLCGIPVADEPLLFESSFIRLTPDSSKIRTEFLLHYLNNDSTRRAHVLSRISGITISGINQAAMNQIPVLVPALAVQDRFVERAGEVISIQTQQAAATAKAQVTFDALLARCFAPDSATEAGSPD